MKLSGTCSSPVVVALAVAVALAPGSAPAPAHAAATGETAEIGAPTLRGSYERVAADLLRGQDTGEERELKGGGGGEGRKKKQRAKKIKESLIDDRTMLEPGEGLGKKVKQAKKVNQKVKKVKNNAKGGRGEDRVGGMINRSGNCVPNIPVGGCVGCVPTYNDVLFMVPCENRCTSSSVCESECCTDYSHRMVPGFQFCNVNKNSPAGCLPWNQE